MSTWNAQLRDNLNSALQMLSGAARTTFYAGVGILDIALEEFEILRQQTAGLATELAERGKTVQETGEDQITDLVQRGQTQSRDLMTRINRMYGTTRLERLWPIATVPRLDEHDRT